MDYLVIARKYRPQTFTEVSGQEVVARTLTNAIRKGRLAHAYLFTGPRGVGKTSMARILAKALCCTGSDGSRTAPSDAPCGICDHCRMITDSTHPDVAEIDAARFTGVDAIRDLADGAAFAPAQARFRIFILDEVHMLSTSAWNALLKVLEEPPPHVRFIFATTEVDKVLETVLSRVQRFDFRPLDQDAIVRRLREIAGKEGAGNLPEVAFNRIARAAGGGMRDAQTLLDQLIAVSDGANPETDLDLLLGAARGDDLVAVADAIISGTPAPALEALDRICAGGVAPATFIEQLVDHVRAVLLVQACGATSPAVTRLGAQVAAAEAHAKRMPGERAQRMCQVLINAQQQLRHGVDPRLLAELTVVRLASLANLVDIDQLLRRLERLESAPPAAPPRPR